MSNIDKVIERVRELLAQGEQYISIYMHSKDAIIEADGAIEKIYHIYFDEVEND